MKEKLENFANVFADNKYMRKYFRIIHQALFQSRVKSSNLYFESHHIYPLALFEPNQDTVLLTAKEHFVCHWLLIKFTSGKHQKKMLYALNNMATTAGGRRSWSPLEYERARKALSEAVRGDLSRGAKISATKKGVKFSDEHKEALRQAHLGVKPSDATKAKRAESLKLAHAEGRHTGMTGKKHADVMTPETMAARGEKISVALTGKPLSEAHKAKIVASGFGSHWVGKTRSEETKKKMAEARKKYWDNKRANENV